MARITTYALDTTPDKNDKVIGSDAGGETRNFSFGGITNFLNTSGLINLDGIVNKFIPENTDLSSGFFKLPSGGTGIPFSAITSLKVSINNLDNLVTAIIIMLCQASLCFLNCCERISCFYRPWIIFL